MPFKYLKANDCGKNPTQCGSKYDSCSIAWLTASNVWLLLCGWLVTRTPVREIEKNEEREGRD
jgi:hypothetical protein